MIRYGLAILAFCAVVGGAYLAGHRRASEACEAETLRTQVEVMRSDVRVARQAEQHAREQLSEMEQAAARTQEVMDALEADLARRPEAARCRLSPADAERLRSIR